MFNFEKLELWQKAIDFADLIYNEARGLPSGERFGLTNQPRRTAVSISPNIAEASSPSSKIDFKGFAEIADGSVFETASHAFIARHQAFLSDDQFRKIDTNAEELSRMLRGLQRSLLSTLNSQL